MNVACRLLVLIFIASCAVNSNAQDFKPSQDSAAEITPEKTEAIKQWLKLTGQYEEENKMKKQMFDLLKTKYTDVPEELWTELDKGVKKGELAEAMVPVLDKHFTFEEMKLLVKAHAVLDKLAKISPQLSKDKYEAGRKIGKAITVRVRKQLESKGYKMKK